MTVVVVTWQAVAFVQECLDSLLRQTVPHRVLVVDNASGDGTSGVLAARPEVTVLRNDRNLGFAGGADRGLRAATTPWVALLNDDAVAEPGWLEALLRAAGRAPEAAAVTSLMMLRTPGSAQVVNNAGVVLLPTLYGADRGGGGAPGLVASPTEVFGFSGGAALLHRERALAVGGFPPEFFLYYEDTDLSWRLRLAGWAVRFEPGAVVHHRHAASSDVRSPLFAFHNERNRLLMLARCAPAGPAAAAWARFALTTASLAVRHARRRRGEQHHNLRVGLRLRVLGSAVARGPALVRQRRDIRRRGRAEVDLTLGR